MHAVWYAQQVGSKLDAAQETVAELMRIAQRQDGARVPPARCARPRADRVLEGKFRGGRPGPHAVSGGRRPTTDRGSRPDVRRRPRRRGLRGERPRPVVSRSPGSGAGSGPEAESPTRRRAAGHMAWPRPSLHATMVELLCGDGDAAAGLAARTARVCADHAIANFGPMSRVLRRRRPRGAGDVEGGLAEMLPALVEHREVVGSHITDLMLGWIATAYGQAGQWDEGLRRVDEGIALGEATREQVYAAELWRVKGELLLGKARDRKRRKRAAADSLVGHRREVFSPRSDDRPPADKRDPSSPQSRDEPGPSVCVAKGLPTRRRANFSARSTRPSRKGLIRRTSKTRRRSWTCRTALSVGRRSPGDTCESGNSRRPPGRPSACARQTRRHRNCHYGA